MIKRYQSQVINIIQKLKALPFTHLLSILLPYSWIILFFLVPFFIILKISLAQKIFAAPPFDHVWQIIDGAILQINLNIGNFIELFIEPMYSEAFMLSIQIAGASTIACLILGYSLAYSITRTSKKSQKLLFMFILLPFWTSFLVRVYAWMSLLSTTGIINTWLIKLGFTQVPLQLLDNPYTVFLGITYCYLPLMIFPIYSSLLKIDSSYLEAASDLGAKPWKTFWSITIPLSKSGIIAGCILVFVPAIGEFVIPELLGGADTVTIGRALWISFFDNQDWPLSSALAICMLFLFIAPVMLFQKYQQKEFDSNEQS